MACAVKSNLNKFEHVQGLESGPCVGGPGHFATPSPRGKNLLPEMQFIVVL